MWDLLTLTHGMSTLTHLPCSMAQSKSHSQTQGKGVGKYAILVFYALQQIAVNLSLIEHISPHSSHGSDVWARFSCMLWKTVIKVSAKAQFSSGGSNGNPWTSKLTQFVRQIYSLVAASARTSVSYSAPRPFLAKWTLMGYILVRGSLFLQCPMQREGKSAGKVGSI